MSKYSRTRKAICCINRLNFWLVSRSYFKRQPIETMKESYRRKRKEYLRRLGMPPKGYSYITGKFIPFPCKYKEALKQFIIWNEC